MGKAIIRKEPVKEPIDDALRLKGGNVYFNLNVFKGKQGDFFLAFSPALGISGYGKTIEEAESLLQLEIDVFCEDILSMSLNERNNFLASIGFIQEKFKTKNFSKAYVDDNGILQDFDEGTIEREVLQTAV